MRLHDLEWNAGVWLGSEPECVPWLLGRPGSNKVRNRSWESIMLSDATVYGVLPATDFERAKKFYEGTLGLKPADIPTDQGYVLYSTKQGTFLVYLTQAPGGAATALGFVVDDLFAEMADLRKRGVVFEEYDVPGLKTVNGVVEMGKMGKGAWFKDSEGNILSISQM